MKDKVIFIGPLPPPFTGQSLSFQMLLRGARNDDIKLRVMNIARNALSARYSSVRASQFLFLSASLFCYLLIGYRKVYLTIAQSKQGFYRDWLFIALAHWFGAEIIVHLKGGNYNGFYEAQPKALQKRIRKTLLRTSKIIVLGVRLVSMYDFEPMLRSRILVVHNGLPFESPTVITPKFIGEKIQLLYLSNMIKSKGYMDVLESIYLLNRSGIKVHAKFAGAFMPSSDDEVKQSAGQMRKEFMSRISQLEIKDQVSYLGSVSGKEKLALIDQSHFFLLPTNYVNEGQPVSIIEAMSFGVVPIVTKFRAITDLVVDGSNGNYVCYRAASDIEKVIKEYVKNPSTYLTASAACLQRYSENFTKDQHLHNLLTEIMD